MATKLDIVIEKGARFTRTLQVRNSDGTLFDLTGYSGRMQIRETLDSVAVLVEATTANGRITINVPSSTVTVTIGADITDAMTWTSGVYDLEVFGASPADVVRVVEGNASLSWQVTR